MQYTLKTPNHLYSGVTEGVPFSQGIGKTDDVNVRNVLVNDYKYEDVSTDYSEFQDVTKKVGETTEKTIKEVQDSHKNLLETAEGFNIEDLTVPQLKDIAKDLSLTNYSKMTKEELIGLISNAKQENA